MEVTDVSKNTQQARLKNRLALRRSPSIGCIADRVSALYGLVVIRVF